MKLTGVLFKVLYLFLYIFLPCGIDVQCDEDDAKVIVYSFVLNDDAEFKKSSYFDGENVYNEISCNSSDFKSLLRKMREEVIQLKEKNAAEINENNPLDKRDKAFNKRVLFVKKEQKEHVLEVFKDVLGCQECPNIILYDKSKEIKDYNDLFFSFSNRLKSNNINKKNDLLSDGYDYAKGIKTIFDTDSKYYSLLTNNYNSANDKEKQFTLLLDIWYELFNCIKEVEQNSDEKFTEENKKLGIEVLDFKKIHEKYKKVETKITSVNPDNINKATFLRDFQEYMKWRELLLRAEIIKTFLQFFKKEENITKLISHFKFNEDHYKIEKIKEDISSVFFTSNFSGVDMDMVKGLFVLMQTDKNPDDTLKLLKKGFKIVLDKNKSIIHNADISSDSFLDIYLLYKNAEGLGFTSLFANFSKKTKKILDSLAGNAFADKKSPLFNIVKIAAGDDKKIFTTLDNEIKKHFNTVIFSYLSLFFKKIKMIANRDGTTYTFQMGHCVNEIVRCVADFIEDKKNHPETVFNAMILLFDELLTFNLDDKFDSLIMEICLICDVLMEYFVYVKELNAYTGEKNKENQLHLKEDNTSNLLDSFYIASTEDYNQLNRHMKNYGAKAKAPKLITSISEKLYEETGIDAGIKSDFKIVVMGDMRAGKTLFIRNVFGEEDRCKFKVGNGRTSTTSTISYYKKEYGKHSVGFIDTPGFEGTEEDGAYGIINMSFNSLFLNEDCDTIVLDLILFKDGDINWLSAKHKETIKKILEKTNRKIIFLIPFTSQKKKAPKIKEKFLASLFYNLFIRDEAIPLEKIKDNYTTFVNRIIAIPINQLHSEDMQESRFGLKDLAKTIATFVIKDDAKFKENFIKSFNEDNLCSEDEDNNVKIEGNKGFIGLGQNRNKLEEKNTDSFNNINNINNMEELDMSYNNIEIKSKIDLSQTRNNLEEINPYDNNFNNINNINNMEKLDMSSNNIIEVRVQKGSLQDILHSLLEGFNGFILNGLDPKKKGIDINKGDEEFEVLKEQPKDDPSYGLLKDIYLFYSLYNKVEHFLTKNFDPLLYEFYRTGLYKMIQFTKSPYFFNYICLDNEQLGYNIRFFEKEIHFIHKKALFDDFFEKKELLAKFCLLADNQFLIDNDFYKKIQGMCKVFNKAYAIKPSAEEKNNVEKTYKEIKEKLTNFLKTGNEKELANNLDLNLLDFVVCYNKDQRRYTLDYSNLCFLEIELDLDNTRHLYEKIPEKLKQYMQNLNKDINKIQDYEEFCNRKDDPKSTLYKRYHHKNENESIRQRECKYIEEAFKDKEEEEKSGKAAKRIKSAKEFIESINEVPVVQAVKVVTEGAGKFVKAVSSVIDFFGW